MSAYHLIVVLCLVVATLIKGQSNHSAHHGPCKPGKGYNQTVKEKILSDMQSITGERVHCVDGMALGYPCNNIALESFVSNQDLSGGATMELNDIWGWTSSDGREFALVGIEPGTSFVEISDTVNPIVLGLLRSYTNSNLWRDIKTFKDHAFIVSEAGGHGVQIFDLTELLTISTTDYNWFEYTAHYSGIGHAHNIFINEDSGYAYVVGSGSCDGGLHMIDINTPTEPIFAGCYSERGYTHDVQCVNYDGPDTDYTHKEICFASNEDIVDIIDVSNKTEPTLISSFEYDKRGYTHQGWLTEDKKFFLVDDEADELYGESNTRTIICDVSDLDKPILKGIYEGNSKASDHNQYVKGRFAYQANYRAGLRILSLDDIENGKLVETAYFDTFAQDDLKWQNGAWSNYPYFDSGVVIISDIEQGLFVVRPILEMFISDLDSVIGTRCLFQRNVTIVVTVSDFEGSKLDGITVKAKKRFSMLRASCVTDVSGQCNLDFEYRLGLFETFQITSLSEENQLYIYNEAKNSDMDGDSDGTSIAVKFQTENSGIKYLLQRFSTLII